MFFIKPKELVSVTSYPRAMVFSYNQWFFSLLAPSFLRLPHAPKTSSPRVPFLGFLILSRLPTSCILISPAVTKKRLAVFASVVFILMFPFSRFQSSPPAYEIFFFVAGEFCPRKPRVLLVPPCACIAGLPRATFVHTGLSRLGIAWFTHAPRPPPGPPPANPHQTKVGSFCTHWATFPFLPGGPGFWFLGKPRSYLPP